MARAGKRSERPVLLAEDDVMLARSLVRVIEPVRPVRVANSAREAREVVVRDAPWCCLLIDVDLGDGSGLDVLAEIRERDAHVPAAIVTARADVPRIQRAFGLRAFFVAKPVVPKDLLGFVAYAATQESGHGDVVGGLIGEIAEQTALTEDETTTVTHAVAGEERARIARLLNVQPKSMKRKVRDLLRKTGDAKLDALALRVLREAEQRRVGRRR